MKNTIPAEIWTQHVGILAKTGRGKTIAAKGGAASLMKDGIRCGVVDPTAAWWGMRIKADGKTPAFPMVIFGGDHGDIAIDARFDKTSRYDPAKMGEKVGALVACAPWSWILDISKLNADTRAPFMTGFAESLFSENKRRINLFLDECHLYMPQQKLPTRASAHMTAACNNLVSGGRSRGFNITMISQRSAKVHKDSLTQAETLITLGMIAPHDIAAVEGWVKVQGDLKAAKAMLESLPALPVGTGWIYAPELGMLDRVKFPMIDTFDSSRAPGVGEDLRAPTELAKIDLDEIRALLAPPGIKRPALTEPRAASKPVEKINTPSLKAQQRELAAARAEGADAVRLGIPALLDAQHAESFEMGYRFAAIAATEMLQGMREAFPEPHPGRKRLKDFHRLMQAQVPNVAPIAPAARPPARLIPSAGPSAPVEGLSKPQAKILESLAWWAAMGHPRPTRVQVGIKARMKANGGHFKTRCSELSGMGLIAYDGADRMKLTEDGEKAAPAPNTGDSILESLRTILSAPQAKILDAMLAGNTDRQDIATVAGMDAAGGHFKTRLSELSSMGIVSYPDKSSATLQPWIEE